MALEKAEGVLLRVFNWSESSRTVIFFTRNRGRLSLIDKGGRSIKSKRGRLLQFTRLEITYYSSDKETDGYISDFDPLESFTFERDGTLGRLAYASAACELCYSLMAEEEPQEDLYDYFVLFLRSVDQVEKHALPALFVAYLLRFMSLMGYHPSLAFCSGCGKELSKIEQYEHQLAFGSQRGGFVCPSCQRVGEYYIPVPYEAAVALSRLQRASLAEASTIALHYDDATRLLEALTGFLQFHAGSSPRLKSLDFLEKLKQAPWR